MSMRPLLVIALLALLSACSTGPVKRISPPTASVQELSMGADGQWQLILRLQNFSNVAMTFDRLDAVLTINGEEAGRIESTLDLDIPGGNADTFRASLVPKQAMTALSGQLAYGLKGNIRSSDPKGNYPFERSSHLMPAPGLEKTWR